MLSVILFCFCISALPVFLSSVLHKKFEEGLPLSFFGGVFFIYLIGLIANIQIGVVLWLAACCLLYLAALFYIVRHKSIKQALKNIFTPPFFLFAFTAALLAILNVGRMPVGWDEFSHWATTVKGMFNINDFAANPLAQDGFGSYPPAMSLLQYAIQVFERFFGGEFSEWKLYYVYQLFSFSLFFPFLKNISKKKLFSFAIALFITIVLFDPGVISSLYIDSFVSLLSAALFAYLLIVNYDAVGISTLCFGLFTLTLSKDIGLFFAIIIIIAHLTIMQKNASAINQSGDKHYALCAACPMLACICAKLSWSIVLAVHGTTIRFSQSISLGELLDSLLGHSGNGKSDVLIKAINKFFSGKLINFNLFEITFFQCFVFLLFAAFFICAINKKCSNQIKAIPIVLSLSIFSLILYTISLPFIYILKFSEEEAAELASFARYLSIANTFVAVILMICLILLATKNISALKPFYVALLILLLIAPTVDILGFFTRTTMHDRYNWIRYQLDTVNEYKLTASNKESVPVACISFYDGVYEQGTVSYYLKPFPNEFISVPINNDINTKPLKEQYDKQLTELASSFKGTYEYIMVLTLNDYFKENCGALFENPNEMREFTVYKVNEHTGLLQLSH